MELKQVHLDKAIEGIHRIMTLSFEKPYSKEQIKERLKDKKY